MSLPHFVASFRGHGLDPRLKWFNPPKRWQLGPEAPGLVVEPEAHTDFWQQTHYGFRADNGHFLHLDLAGDFTVWTKVHFAPAHQYDQAGLMVRAGPMCWIKTSVEYEPRGPARLGAVVTNHGFSDWSVQDFPRESQEVCLRIARKASDFVIEYARGERADWNLLRVAHLDLADATALAYGLYACSPKGAGFRAVFAFLRIEPG